MERSFKKEVESLKLGDGDVFRGEGILAVTKALLQSGVSYVGGYQGAPVSHLLDVMVEAEDLLADLGVHVETCTNEASAAAMLGASINYPLRGAVTWKSIVGTNVAADALSNLSSPGVVGGVMIILGEDYGEGASVIQERSYAYAMKSSMWLLDPRPDLPTIVRMVEKGFELSEASHAPVMMELRIRACHVTGEFADQEQQARRVLRPQPHPRPAALRIRAGSRIRRRCSCTSGSRSRSACPPRSTSSASTSSTSSSPATSTTSASSSAAGSPTACCARSRGSISPRSTAHRACRSMCSTASIRWCRRKCASSAPASARCWWSRKARPTTSSSRSTSSCAAPTSRPACFGKGALPKTGDYTSDVAAQRACRLPRAKPAPPASMPTRSRARVQAMLAHKPAAAASLGDMPVRPPTFCTGCPERPVFSAIKLMQRELGPTHISRRHRLPCVRDLRAVQHGQFHPRLRHVARERRRGDAQSRPPPDRRDGRRRLLAQRPDHRRRRRTCSTRATAC